MPQRFKRFLLAVLIALAVPVQGFAAISAGLCTALGHHGEQDHASHAAPSATHDGHSQHHHQGDNGHGPCGPCVGCCASAAIVSTAVVALSLVPAPSPDALASMAPAGVQPAPLDRPPLAL